MKEMEMGRMPRNIRNDKTEGERKIKVRGKCVRIRRGTENREEKKRNRGGEEWGRVC